MRKAKLTKTCINCNESYEAESIERKIRRITTNNEPIEESVPLIYQEEAVGVQPEFDIRTDRFEIALEAMDKVTATLIAKRDEKPAETTTETTTEPK